MNSFLDHAIYLPKCSANNTENINRFTAISLYLKVSNGFTRKEDLVTRKLYNPSYDKS